MAALIAYLCRRKEVATRCLVILASNPRFSFLSRIFPGRETQRLASGGVVRLVILSLLTGRTEIFSVRLTPTPIGPRTLPLLLTLLVATICLSDAAMHILEPGALHEQISWHIAILLMACYIPAVVLIVICDEERQHWLISLLL
jgi:hypothetical protein